MFDNQVIYGNPSWNWDTPIYRVYSIERIIELYETRKNTLVKPKKWDDPFENVLSRVKLRSKKENAVLSFQDIHSHYYGQCWTYNAKESDALWRIYSPTKIGVRVKSTLNKLFSEFYRQDDAFKYSKYWIGNVIYQTEKEIIDRFKKVSITEFIDPQGASLVETLFIKRVEFEHEIEVRVVFNDVEKTISGDAFSYSIDPNYLIEEILFDPRFEDHYYGCSTKHLQQLGCVAQISKSSLYQIPEIIGLVDL